MFDISEMFDSRDVAAYIAQQCREKGIEYNNTKIQKLLYCVYGVILAEFGKRICDEYPKAWPYGPVFPKVFKYIHKGENMDMYSNRLKNELSEEEKNVIDEILSFFGRYMASQLSSWSHRPGSPWSKVVEEEGTGWNVVLRDEDISKYFKGHVLAK